MATLLTLLREIQLTPAELIDVRFADRVSLVGRAGQRLYRANESIEEIYVLLSGYARAYVGESGSGRTTLLVKGPALLGDRELIADCGARDSVRLLTSANLISVPREDFLSEWSASAELRAWITADLIRRYTSSLSWFALGTSSLADRVSGLLAILEPLGLPVRDLASVLGVSERSVFRALAELRARNAETDAREATSEPLDLLYTLADEPQSRDEVTDNWPAGRRSPIAMEAEATP
jgi:CRP-like cAMP-binding protein